MEKGFILKRIKDGHVNSQTVPLPVEYLQELVPPFPVDNNIRIEPVDEKIHNTD